MKPKHKSLLFNFLGFTLVFFLLRFVIVPLFMQQDMFVMFISAFLSVIVAPKFFVQKVDRKEQVFMKILFLKTPIAV
ncbi:hypothetical protein [Neptunitalea chrysea]|uniref:hypothetical protein n=1 Tax=Neptunitalea chrysea TaxID=1647581 RepID=UPI0024933253|nr:hypothetical protein [Neptunitalea chrysea]